MPFAPRCLPPLRTSLRTSLRLRLRPRPRLAYAARRAYSSRPTAPPSPAPTVASLSVASPAMASPSSAPAGASDEPSPAAQGRRALPPPSPDGVALDVGGAGTSFKLDALGPMVVNHDGTLSRVTNWAGMTPAEQQTTLTMLARRNKQRLTALNESRGASTS